MVHRLPQDLLGGHVVRRAHGHAGQGDAIVSPGVGDPEVGDEHLIPGKQQVSRLEVPVDDAQAVNVAEGITDLLGQIDDDLFPERLGGLGKI